MLLAIPFGLAIGLSLGALGGGGSVLAVPVLVYVLGFDVTSAATASLMVVTAGAVAGGLGHAREGRVCWRHAVSFTGAALPGLVAGTLAADTVGQDVLIGVFAAIMLFAARATWRKASEPEDGDDWQGRDACPPLRLPRDLLAGAAIGFLTGFLGVGGGFLIVPTLAIAFAFTMRTAVGTSLAIITATSLIGLGVHLLAGRSFDGEVAGAMTAACAVGALAGAQIASKVPRRTLGRGFAALVLAVAAYLVASIAFLGGPPA